jgi:ABC-type proline/glycine betaine transport system ATPase subunit
MSASPTVGANASPAVLVHAKGLRKDYGSGEGLVRALDAVDLDVTQGETLAVMGPSGCGKSTLLQLIGGLDRPSAGELSVAGRRLDKLSERALAHLRRDEIGFVFQAFHLMDELTAQENVELPALLAGCSPSDARARATALLAEVDLADRVRHLPSRTSVTTSPRRFSSCSRLGRRLRLCRLDCPCMGRRMIPMRRPERQRMAPTWLRTRFPPDPLATSRRTQPS